MTYSRYVSTKIGTIGDMTATSVHGGGKTHPGAICPFGMVQFGPDTFEGGDNGSGYSYHHTTIDGFSINHMAEKSIDQIIARITAKVILYFPAHCLGSL